MPATRSQGLLTKEAPKKTKVPPRTLKKKSGKGAKATTQPPSSVAESPLFKLPPELRTMIYRHAIISNRALRITMSRGIPEAPLLSVNKLLRAETFGLFYRENKFNCIVRNYDHAPSSWHIASCRL